MASDTPKLIVVSTDLRGHEFVIDQPDMTIGRGADNGVVIDLASISRNHARLLREGDHYVLHDLGSRNGIKVDGRVVGKAVLRSGALVTIGDVELQFVGAAGVEPALPPAAPQSQAAAAAPASDQAVPATQDQEAALPVAVEEEPPGRQKALGRWMGVLVAILAAAGVIATIFIYMRRGEVARVLYVDPILIRVGEKRWVSVDGLVGSRRSNKRMRRVQFKEETIRLSDRSVASAAKFDDGELVVEGLAGGNTDVTMRSLRNNLIVLRVIVRGRIEDPLSEIDRTHMSEEERTERADEDIRAADRTADTKIYQAILAYRRAQRVLRPIKNKSPLYLEAYRKEKEMNRRLDAEYDRLSRETRAALAANDPDAAVDVMTRILELIPDQGDPRHQRTQYYMAHLVKIEEARKR